MGLGVIGLGSAGTDMVRRLKKVGHQCIVYDVRSISVQTLANEEPVEAISIEEFVNKLSKPRALWLMAPIGELDAVLTAVIPYLDPEDLVIDACSTYCRDYIGQSAELKTKGIHLVEIGLSGAERDMDRRKNITIGAPSLQYEQPMFLPVETPLDLGNHVPGRRNTYGDTRYRSLRCEPSDAEGFPKMTNTRVGHGMMVAYDAGMNILHHANGNVRNQYATSEANQLRSPVRRGYNVTVDDTAEMWRRGSMISSWLLDLAASALHGSPGKFVVRASDSGEGRWTVIAAVDESVQAPVLAAALYERVGPHGEAEMADKVLSALRFRFIGC